MTHQQMTLDEFATRGMKAQAAVDKLCHADDPETSRQAAQTMVESGALSKQEKMVFRGIQHHLIGSHKKDFTAIELAKWMLGETPKNYYIIQRRLSGLRHKGKIERIGEKRDGCCVWKLT